MNGKELRSRSRLASLTLGVALAVLGARDAGATGWHLDVQTGAYIPAGTVELEKDGVDVDSGLGTGLALVLGGGYGVNSWLDLTSQLQGASTLDLFDDNADVISLTGGARVFPFPSLSRVRPWVGAQLGWYRVHGNLNAGLFSSSREVDVTDNSFGVNAGGGVDVPVSQRVSLGADVRYHDAFEALNGFTFVTTMFNVSIALGEQS